MPSHFSAHSPGWAAAGVDFSCVALTPEPGVARLTLSGELDLSTAPVLGEALSNVGDAVEVIVDLSQVTFLDSSGLHTMLAAHARLSEAQRRLVLVPGPPAVQRIFELTGTDRVFEFAHAPDAGDQQSSNGHSRNRTTRSGRYAGPTLRATRMRRQPLK